MSGLEFMREKGYAGTTVLAVGKVIMGKVPERAPGKSTHSMFYAYIFSMSQSMQPAGAASANVLHT